MAQYTAPAELLMDYAAGTLPEAESLLVATHLSLCPQSRREVSRYEQVGGTMLDSCEAAEVSPACRERVLKAITALAPEPAANTSRDEFVCRVLPAPLRSYVGCGASEIKWTKRMKGLDALDLPVKGKSPATKARLLRIKPGTAIPEHNHQGEEYTLLLSGSMEDGRQTFRRGDIAVSGPETRHAPKAGAGEDCVCLVVTTAPIQLTGIFGRFLNPFVRF